MGIFDHDYEAIIIFKRDKPAPERVSYIMTQDGNISIVQNGKTTQVASTHPNHAQIVARIEAGQLDGLDELIDVPAAITREFENVTVDEFGHVYYNGNQVGGVIAQRIMEFMRAGKDFAPLALFLSNLMENPSARAIKELYGFLENEAMPITPDGCFMAYKGITRDWLDKFSRTFNNSIGQVLEMPRQEVDDDCTATCSYGFHVGSHKYATGWAGSDGRLILVKVNPRDAVSVPKEHGADKLRVCRYEVIEEAQPIERPEGGYGQAWAPLEGPTYGEADEDEEYCDNCGDLWCDGECYEEEYEDDDEDGEPELYFDTSMGRWRDRTQGGRVVSEKEWLDYVAKARHRNH